MYGLLRLRATAQCGKTDEMSSRIRTSGLGPEDWFDRLWAVETRDGQLHRAEAEEVPRPVVLICGRHPLAKLCGWSVALEGNAATFGLSRDPLDEPTVPDS